MGEDRPTNKSINKSKSDVNRSEVSELAETQGENKLAELNNLLKNKEFKIQSKDEDEFE